MLRFMRTHCSNLCNKRGFTLVEVLAVLVILGILAVVATVSVIGLVEKSREDVCEVNRI